MAWAQKGELAVEQVCEHHTSEVWVPLVLNEGEGWALLIMRRGWDLAPPYLAGSFSAL